MPLKSTQKRMNDAVTAMLALPAEQWTEAGKKAVYHERRMQHHPDGGKGMMKLLLKNIEGAAQGTKTVVAILKNEDLDLDPASLRFKIYEVLTLAVIFRDYPEMYGKLVADAKNRANPGALIAEYDEIAKDPDALLAAGKALCELDEEKHMCGGCTLAETFKVMDWMIEHDHERICTLFKQYARVPRVVDGEFVWSTEGVEDEDEDMKDLASKSVTSAKTTKAKKKAGKKGAKRRY